MRATKSPSATLDKDKARGRGAPGSPSDPGLLPEVPTVCVVPGCSRQGM